MRFFLRQQQIRHDARDLVTDRGEERGDQHLSAAMAPKMESEDGDFLKGFWRMGKMNIWSGLI